MRWPLLALSLLAGCDPTITDPCPGQLSCPDDACCPLMFPYHCGGQCSPSPCGAGQLTCVSAGRTDGCYGGTWSGAYSGTFQPAGGAMSIIQGTIKLDVTDHAIVVTSPSAGSGSVDCASGEGTWTLAQPALVFHGTWMHTSDMGDEILAPTISASAAVGTAAGTWTAVRTD